MKSKADCGANCVCYDTCPLGKTNYPIEGQGWIDLDPMSDEGKLISLPCSGRGVC